MIRLFLLLSLPLFILDQLTKSWIVANFRLYETEQEVIPGIFWLHHAANTGVAFGMFNGTQYANYAFTAVSLAALVFIYVMHGKGLFPGKLSRTAVALLVSGVFGNLTDRLFRTADGGHLSRRLCGRFPEVRLRLPSLPPLAFVQCRRLLRGQRGDPFGVGILL